MQFLSILMILAFSAKIASAEFSGDIKLYRDTDFRYNLAIFNFAKSNRCFNMCGDYNDAVSSAKWTGLPTAASYEGTTEAKLVFYVDTGCKGKSKSYLTSLGSVKSFVDEGINDEISSFMVLETSEDIENGETSLCSLSRALKSISNATTAD